jgi:hypothetical protein
VESALKNRHKRFVIDGEAAILGVDGIADFNGAPLPAARRGGGWQDQGLGGRWRFDLVGIVQCDAGRGAVTTASDYFSCS